MNIRQKIFDEVCVLEQQIHRDSRGIFFELAKTSGLKDLGIIDNFNQTNISISDKKHTLRGLHTQIGDRSQAKLLSVIKGSILDVVVNIDHKSIFFGKWKAIKLSQKGPKSIYIPPHYLHGFVTIEANTTVVYQCSEEYSPNHERTVRFNDQSLKIRWGLDEDEVHMSEKDKKGISFDDLISEIRG